MASSNSVATRAASTDTTSTNRRVRVAGEIASHALSRGLETLRGLALGGSSGGSSSSIGVKENVMRHINGNRLESRSAHNQLNIHKRHLSGGAIAGITVGVVITVALLAICLYPCFLYYKRRRGGHSHPPFDPETGVAGTGHGSSASGGANTPSKRLSSSDSYRHKGDLTRGREGDGGSADYGSWEAPPIDHGINNGYSFPLNTAYLQPGDPGFVDGSVADEYRVKAQPFPLLGCEDGEFAPPMSDDPEPGVLKGTSADYYSPHIPSEAFGMVTQPDTPFDPPAQLPSSRASSLRYNVMQMFRRKTGRDATLDSTVSRTTIPEGALRPDNAQLDGATPLQTMTSGDRVESPTNLSAASLPLSRHQPDAEAAAEASLAPVSPPVSNAPEPHSKVSPPESSLFPSYHQFRKPPSPPVAAPGTVNPMDIMPASTETEVWHKTEHQMYEAFHKPSRSDPADLLPQEAPANGTAMPSPSPTPPETQLQPTFTVQSPDSTNHTGFIPDHTISNADQAHTQIDDGDVAMQEMTLPLNHDHRLAAPDGRHPSFPSDHSTPLPPSFTDVSSQNTPSTGLDSPSPESVGSSDFRHSASPHSGAGSHSPRAGVYRCDEPGCSQSFDQPHKLKHHQRYHSKDHKCPYPGCGKGFGTKTHLQRHINDRHEKKKKFHCSIAGCDYSRAGGKAFPRKDNWKRHMMKIHNIEQQQLPEPIEVDMDVDGI